MRHGADGAGWRRAQAPTRPPIPRHARRLDHRCCIGRDSFQLLYLDPRLLGSNRHQVPGSISNSATTPASEHLDADGRLPSMTATTWPFFTCPGTIHSRRSRPCPPPATASEHAHGVSAPGWLPRGPHHILGAGDAACSMAGVPAGTLPAADPSDGRVQPVERLLER